MTKALCCSLHQKSAAENCLAPKSLKTLLECVRMKTFSRFGFQQMQVDVHYLSLYLWRFVSDENLVTFMLDEIMSSAVHRCYDTDIVPMEQSVVELICDRN